MKNIINRLICSIVLITLSMSLVACSSNKEEVSLEKYGSQQTKSSEKKEIKIACMSTCQQMIEWIGEGLEPLGYDVKAIMFDANQLPATALKDGDVDGLIHNHLPWIKMFNKENNSNLKMPDPLAYGRTAVYSSKYKSKEELPQNAKIAVPGDPTNLDRSLLILRDMGLITLGEKSDVFYTLLDIKDNPKNIKIVETEISTTIRSITDVDAVIAPALRAKLAGIDPNIFLYEDTGSKDYPMGLVVDEKSMDEEWVKEAIKFTHSKEFKEKFDEYYGGAYIMFDR